MAGDDEAHRVGGAGAGDGTHSGRALDAFRHLAVGACLPEGNRPQEAPDLPLKGRGTDIQREVGVWHTALGVIPQRADPGSQGPGAFLERGRRKLGAQLGDEWRVRIAQLHGADARAGSGHEQPAQR